MKDFKDLKQLLSLRKQRKAVKKRGRPRRRSRPRGSGEYDTVENFLINELVRISILEEKIKNTLSETFLNLFDETLKQKMHKLSMESEIHYHMLIKTVDGLEKFKMKSKKHLTDASPLEFQGKPMVEVLENLYTFEKSATMVYETILKLLDKLSDQAEIKREGLRIIPEKLKICCKKISAAKQLHISIIDEILDLYRDKYVRPQL